MSSRRLHYSAINRHFSRSGAQSIRSPGNRCRQLEWPAPVLRSFSSCRSGREVSAIHRQIPEPWRLRCHGSAFRGVPFGVAVRSIVRREPIRSRSSRNISRSWRHKRLRKDRLQCRSTPERPPSSRHEQRSPRPPHCRRVREWRRRPSMRAEIPWRQFRIARSPWIGPGRDLERKQFPESFPTPEVPKSLTKVSRNDFCA